MQNVNRPRVDPKQVRKSLLIWGIVAVVVIAGTQVGWGNIWREGLIRPMLNALLVSLYLSRAELYRRHHGVYGSAAIDHDAAAGETDSLDQADVGLAAQDRRAAENAMAATKRGSCRSSRALYKTAGVSPFGGCLPTLVQFPIWIGLYQSINAVLADTPLELMNLGKNIYVGFQALVDIIPLQSQFLWLNLAQPDPTPFVLPVLVGATMWLQQKMMTQPSGDTQQASMNQTMQIMMPLMFGYFTTQFASGLALYFLISNVVGIIMQWAIERLEKPAVVAPRSNRLRLPLTIRKRPPMDGKSRDARASVEYSAKTLGDALKRASEELQLTVEELDYEVLRDTTHSILGFVRTGEIVIRVWPPVSPSRVEATEVSEVAQTPEPLDAEPVAKPAPLADALEEEAEYAASGSKGNPPELEKISRDVVATLLDKMGILAAVEVADRGGQVDTDE